MIIASFTPQNYRTVSEALAQAICMTRGGQAFSYFDSDLKRKDLMTHYHLRMVNAQARLNGQIQSMSGEELAERIGKEDIELHVHLQGVKLLISNKSAMGSVRLKFKTELALAQKNKSLQHC